MTCRPVKITVHCNEKKRKVCINGCKDCLSRRYVGNDFIECNWSEDPLLFRVGCPKDLDKGDWVLDICRGCKHCQEINKGFVSCSYPRIDKKKSAVKARELVK